MLADSAEVDKGMLADVDLQGLILGGPVITELTAVWPFITVDHHVAVPVQLVLEFTVTGVAVVQELPLALPGLETDLLVTVFDLPVLHVVALPDMFQQVLDVGVLLVAEAAVLLDLLVHPLHVHFQVAFAEAAEGAVLAAELLPCVFAQVDAQVGLDCTGVITVRALERLLVGVNPQVRLQGMLKLEHLVAVLTREDLQLSLCQPRGGDKCQK